MAYLRFLTDKDYIAIATEEHMKQLIREVHDRIPMAEQRAEMQMREYLDQYYEIEKVLAVGKNIRDYNVNITYPAHVHVKKDGDIFKTLTCINGLKKPTKVKYWRHIVDFVDPRFIDAAKKYSQLRMYSRGEVAMFGTEYWECLVPHGYDGGEIHVPGVDPWREAEIIPWEPNLEWKKDQVCSYGENFYQYLKDDTQSDNPTDQPTQPANPDPENPDNADGTETLSEEDAEGEEPAEPTDPPEPFEPSDEVLTPEEDDDWGPIGDYSEELEYSFDENTRDYVVAEDTVFYAVINPNPDKLEIGVNIEYDDPRNQNVVSHLSRIALYHLHSIISPTNISETRRWAYEDSIQWLYNASKFKINPQLPRKHERGSCMPKVDWALETYQRDYNPDHNAWLI